MWYLLLCCYVCWPAALHVVEFILLAICIRNAFDTFICVCVFHFHFCFCFSFLFKYDYQTDNQHKFVYPGFGQLPGQRIRGKFKSTAEWENMSSHSITTVRTLPPTHSLHLCLSPTHKQTLKSSNTACYNGTTLSYYHARERCRHNEKKNRHFQIEFAVKVAEKNLFTKFGSANMQSVFFRPIKFDRMPKMQFPRIAPKIGTGKKSC